MLRSLNAITKETPITTRDLRRASPDPGLGSEIELSGRDASSLFDLLGVGKTLSGERITAEEPPPTLLQVQPARPGGDENVMDTWMLFQPGAGLETVVTREVIGDHVDVARRIVGFDVGE